MTPISVTDARGTGAGWTLSLAAADPINGSSKAISFTNFTLNAWRGNPGECGGNRSGKSDRGDTGTLSGSDASPGSTLSTAAALLIAPPNQGMGAYTKG